MLHPGIGNQNPESRKSGPYDRQPGRSKVETLADLVPAEKHHGNKGRFHKESQYTLDSERSAEDVTYKPTVVRPVRPEFEFEDQPGSNTDGEINAKQFHPELRCLFPKFITRFVIDGLHDGLYDAESQRERDEQPVVHGCESELRS